MKNSIGSRRAILVLTVVLMALSPLISSVSASISPENYANMKAFYGHKAPDQTVPSNDTTCGSSSRAILKYWDLSFSLGWQGTAQDFSDWQNEITGTNRKLYDGTDGQMALRKIDIYNNRDRWDYVNVHLNSGTGRAYTYRGGYGYSGVYIEQYQNDLGMGGKVLQHEFGHYGLGLPDEYTDAHGPFCKCTQGTTYDTDEWCCASTHCVYDPSFCNANGEAQSCWVQMGNNFPGLTVKNPPTAGPTDPPAPTFIWHFPDLQASNSNLQINPVQPKTGDQVTISLDIFNKESLVKSNVDVSFYDNAGGSNTLIGTKSFYIGSYITTASITWTATPGQHTVTATVDSSDVIKEMNENNNTAIMTFNVNSPPVISPNLKELHTKEDTPLVVDLSKYESDAENGNDNASLKWTVTNRDTKVITKVTGEGSADDVLSFYTNLYWHGKTTVQLTLTDSVGLKATRNVDLYWDFVNHKPWVDSIMMSTTSVLRTESTTVTVSVQDIEDKITSMSADIQYKPSADTVWMDLRPTVNGDAYETVMNTDITWPTGYYDLRARVTDSDQLISDWSYLNGSLAVMNNPPEVLQVTFAEDITNGIYRMMPVTVLIKATDKESLIEALKPHLEVAPCGSEDWEKVDTEPEMQGDIWAITYIPPADAATDKNYCFAAYVIDEANDTSDRVISDEVKVLNNPPTVTSIVASEKNVLRTKNILLTVKGGDLEQAAKDLSLEITYKRANGNDEAAYISEIAYQPGGTDNNGTWTARFTPAKGAKLGEYEFSARLRDGQGPGAWFAQPDLAVNVKNNDPAAVIVPVSSATAGTPVSFDATGSKDVEDTGLTYLWDFGDQGSAKGIKTSHTYANAGKFKVTLTVADSDGGKATTTTTVDVKAKNILTGGTGGGINVLYLMLVFVLVIVIVVIVAVMLAKRKRAKAPPPLPPQAPPTVAPAPETQPPIYKVEAYKVYDSPELGQKEYGEQEMRRAYK